MRLEFGTGINIQHAERATADLWKLSVSRDVVHVDFSSVRHIDPGATWRLVNALALVQPTERLHVQVGARTPQHRDWFRLFTRSMLGPVNLASAGEVLSGVDDITSAVRGYYRGTSIVAQNSLGYLGLHREDTDVNLDDFDAFLGRLAGDCSRLPVLKDEFFRSTAGRDMARLCYESAQNTLDHANKSPRPRHIVSSYLALRYHKTVGRGVEFPGGFREYIDSIIPLQEAGHVGASFLEVVVSDSGAGVAARYAQDLGIYSDLDREREILLAALSPGASVKPVAGDSTVRGDPGFGFTWIADSLSKLKAYALLRTGHHAIVFDGSVSEPDWAVQQSGTLLPGTVLSVLLPEPRPQLALPLGGEG